MVHPSAECSWQRTEAVRACNVLNRMRDLGRPASRIVKFRLRVAEWPMTSQPPSYRGYRSPSERHCQVNESGTYEGGLIRDQAAVTAVHTVNARARNIR